MADEAAQSTPAVRPVVSLTDIVPRSHRVPPLNGSRRLLGCERPAVSRADLLCPPSAAVTDPCSAWTVCVLGWEAQISWRWVGRECEWCCSWRSHVRLVSVDELKSLNWRLDSAAADKWSMDDLKNVSISVKVNRHHLSSPTVLKCNRKGFFNFLVMADENASTLFYITGD